MDDYGTLIVPPLLADFIANYPLIHVEMETGLTSSMTDRLGEAFRSGDRDASGRARRGRVAAHRAGGVGAERGASCRRHRIRCRSRSIRRAACSGAGRCRRSTRQARPWRLAFVSQPACPAVEAIAAQGLAGDRGVIGYLFRRRCGA